MAQEHPFTIKVQALTLHAGRHRWTIFKGGQPCDISPVSYATQREALFAADTALKRLITTLAVRRPTKHP